MQVRGNIYMTSSCRSSSCSFLSISKTVDKIEKLTVIDDVQITFLLYYWIPEASNLWYLFFHPITVHPVLKKIYTI